MAPEHLLFYFLLVPALLTALEKVAPSIESPDKTWKETGTDLFYFILDPFFLLPWLTTLGRVIALFALAQASQIGWQWSAGGSPVQSLPFWAEVALFLLLVDLTTYWTHRLSHRLDFLWRFHLIHHSAKAITWISSQRLHPVNRAITRVPTAVVVTLLGASPWTIAVGIPFIVFYSWLIHANLSWTFGPLSRVFVSPVFHRWHHTTRRRGFDANFSAMFSFFDVIFGTFYLPEKETPSNFGVEGTNVPENYLKQILFPFLPSSKIP